MFHPRPPVIPAAPQASIRASLLANSRKQPCPHLAQALITERAPDRSARTVKASVICTSAAWPPSLTAA
jgi:hypothetical protein